MMPDMKLLISEVMFIKGNGTKMFADTGSLFYQNSLFNYFLSSLLAIPVKTVTRNYS